MKKQFVFIVLTVILLLFFACDLQIPSAIQVKGSTELRFASVMDFGKMFTDMLEQGFEGMDDMSIIPCIQTADQTFLVYMELFNVTFSVGEDIDGNPILSLTGYDDINISDYLDQTDPNLNHILDEEMDVVEEDEEPMVVPLSGMGDYLKGFKFDDDDLKGHKTKLFFSSSEDNELLKKLSIEVFINGESTGKNPILAIGNQSSGLKDMTEYNGSAIPAGGLAIEIPFDGRDVDVTFRLFFPEGTELTKDDFDDGDIIIEIAIWLPLRLVPIQGEDPEIVYPEGIFDAENDLFGRKDPNDDSLMADMIESLFLEIKFNVNPFKGADLVVFNMCSKVNCVEQGCNCGRQLIQITNKLNGDAFSFKISEDDMKLINSPEHWPFTPNFKLHFGSESEVIFPREFKTEEFAFVVNINYTHEL